MRRRARPGCGPPAGRRPGAPRRPPADRRSAEPAARSSPADGTQSLSSKATNSVSISASPVLRAAPGPTVDVAPHQPRTVLGADLGDRRGLGGAVVDDQHAIRPTECAEAAAEQFAAVRTGITIVTSQLPAVRAGADGPARHRSAAAPACRPLVMSPARVREFVPGRRAGSSDSAVSGPANRRTVCWRRVASCRGRRQYRTRAGRLRRVTAPCPRPRATRSGDRAGVLRCEERDRRATSSGWMHPPDGLLVAELGHARPGRRAGPSRPGWGSRSSRGSTALAVIPLACQLDRQRPHQSGDACLGRAIGRQHRQSAHRGGRRHGHEAARTRCRTAQQRRHRAREPG